MVVARWACWMMIPAKSWRANVMRAILSFQTSSSEGMGYLWGSTKIFSLRSTASLALSSRARAESGEIERAKMLFAMRRGL